MHEHNDFGQVAHSLQVGSFPTHRRYFQTGESDHTGFVHMGARYYDPSIGRFLTPDPIDASVSAYTFASGNPIMFFDPSGLSTTQPEESRPIFNREATRNDRRMDLKQILGITKRRGRRKTPFDAFDPAAAPIGVIFAKRDYEAGAEYSAKLPRLSGSEHVTNQLAEASGGTGAMFSMSFGVRTSKMFAEASAALSSSSDKSGHKDATTSASGGTTSSDGTGEEANVTYSASDSKNSKAVQHAKEVNDKIAAAKANLRSARLAALEDDGRVFEEGDIFATVYSIFQGGGGKPLHVPTNLLGISASQSDLTPVKDSPGKWRLDLYALDPTSSTSLALGTLELTDLGNGEYSVDNERYDFDIKDNMTTLRDWGTAASATLHYGLTLGAPLIFGGPFDIKFHGTLTINP